MQGEASKTLRSVSQRGVHSAQSHSVSITEYISIKKRQRPLRLYYICLLSLKAGSCKENDNRAPGGSIEQYYIVLVCTLLISCVHCTVGWVDFGSSAFAGCQKLPYRYKMGKISF